jgi:hypothetical protein
MIVLKYLFFWSLFDSSINIYISMAAALHKNMNGSDTVFFCLADLTFLVIFSKTFFGRKNEECAKNLLTGSAS